MTVLNAIYSNAYRIALVAWALTGIDLATLLLSMSATDFTANYIRMTWCLFTIELMWAVGTVVVMVVATVRLVRCLRAP